MIDFFKILLIGIVEGITEWLPVSSTGHMILVDELIKLPMTEAFKSVFLVVIQLGAILAVVANFYQELWPFSRGRGPARLLVSRRKLDLWLKILVACIPAGLVGVLFDDWIDQHLYNYWVVSLSLIVFGVFFILVEKSKPQARVHGLADISYRQALIIGLYQVLAAVFPGTSRSGATILGGLLLGLDRLVITEFTFFLAIPVMAGASLLKLLKYGLAFTASELAMLVFGMLVAYGTSYLTIKGLLNYIKKNDFKAFGYYRIGLGLLVLFYFLVLA